MSNNNFYKILNNFNKVAQEPQQPTVQQPKAKTKLQESIDVVAEKYMGFKKVEKAAAAGGAKDPAAVAAAIGRKKYGKEKFQKAAAAGKKMGEAAQPTMPTKKAEPVKKKPMTPFGPKDKVDEKAPPGAKAERMVKHIKKSYAKDGKLTPKEKGIAYATAWKAHNKGKIEEAIKAMFEAGYSREQIVEGWEEMMKDVEKRHKEEKGTGKFDKKKTDKGTKYTRKYDPKSGESEDTGKDGEGKDVKKKRGRPKKTNESFVTASKMIAETFRSLVEGRIEGGVWVDKPGNVPVPQNPEVAKPTPKAAPAKPAADMGSAAKAMMAPNKVDPKAKVIPSDPEGVKEDDAEGMPIKGITNFPPKSTKGVTNLPTKTPTMATKQDAQHWDDVNKFKSDYASGVSYRPTSSIAADVVHNTDQSKVKEDDMEEGNAFTGALAKAKADGVQPGEKMKVGGKEYPVKEDAEEDAELEESLNQMRRIAGLPVVESKDKKADKDYDGDGEVESGKDEYLGSKIAAAKKAGKLKEGEMCSKCDCDPCECDDDKEKVDECMSPIAGMAQEVQDNQGKMNINTSMDSDGHKSVTITADGDAAGELMQMLKLAGMGGNHPSEEPEGVMVVAQDDEEEVDEDGINRLTGKPLPPQAPEKDAFAEPASAPKAPASGPSAYQQSLQTSADQGKSVRSMAPQNEAKDDRYHASTTPDEKVLPVQSQTKGGDGDVAGQEKKMRKHGYKFSDNPLAMSENATLKLMREYESIKAKK